LDVGRAYWALVALKDAVSEGASYAAAYPKRETQIKNRALESSTVLVTLQEDMFSVEYVDPLTKGEVGEPITVSVAYDLVVVNPVINAIVPDGAITLRTSDTQVIYSDPDD
jgi:hypothetical protein